MSEYWVSHKKYFCRYCEIYIADDIPSRQQHENGLRHKGNTERFIRGLYKSGEKRKKDLEEEKREMARVEQAAQIAFAQDVSSGLAKSTTQASPATRPTQSTSTASRKPPPKPSNLYANYSTAEFLGYKDPDAERLQAESQRRQTQGVAGDWEVVAVAADGVPSSAPSSNAAEAGPSLKRELITAGVEEEDSRQFKLRKKTLGGGLGEIYDPGIIPIKLKKEEEEGEEKEEPVEAREEVPSSAGEAKPIPALKWTKVKWKRAGDDAKLEPEGNDSGLPADADTKPLPVPEGEVVKSESLPSLPQSEQQNHVQVKSQETPSVPSALEGGGETLFRKRKTPAGTGRGKRQV